MVQIECPIESRFKGYETAVDNYHRVAHTVSNKFDLVYEYDEEGYPYLTEDQYFATQKLDHETRTEMNKTVLTKVYSSPTTKSGSPKNNVSPKSTSLPTSPTAFRKSKGDMAITLGDLKKQLRENAVKRAKMKEVKNIILLDNFQCNFFFDFVVN
jgi:hypothetical protein